MSERVRKRAERGVAEFLGGCRVSAFGRTRDVVQVGNNSKGGLVPLTTAEIYAKLGVEEGRPLYLLAFVSDEDGSFQGYGGTFPAWIDGEEVPTKHGRILYVFTSAEKAEEFAKKTNWREPDPAYPEVDYEFSDWGWIPDDAPGHAEPVEADLRDVVYAVAYFSHDHTLAIDAGPNGEGRYIPLQDFGWSRELVEVRRAFPAATQSTVSSERRPSRPRVTSGRAEPWRTTAPFDSRCTFSTLRTKTPSRGGSDAAVRTLFDSKHTERRGRGAGLSSDCAAIKPGGAKCRARAMKGSQWCFNHHPDTQTQRKRNAAKGGRAGGHGRTSATNEVVELREKLRQLAEDTLNGSLEVNVRSPRVRGCWWKPKKRSGKVIWASPYCGFWYSEEMALQLLWLDEELPGGSMA